MNFYLPQVFTQVHPKPLVLRHTDSTVVGSSTVRIWYILLYGRVDKVTGGAEPYRVD
jgi:hypothetical protein